jgi:hypothetical protein
MEVKMDANQEKRTMTKRKWKTLPPGSMST